MVIATRNLPWRAPGLQEEETDTPQEREISEELFPATPGKGLFVSDEKQLRNTLAHSLKPDFTTSPHAPEIGFVHRKLPFGDLYFLANTSNHPISTNATFRASQPHAEWWDPASGNASQISANSSVELNLQPYESRVILFLTGNSLATDQSKTRTSVSGPAREILDLERDWTVTFPNLGRTVHMDRLHPWADQEETRFYSGDAVYEKNFDVSPEILNSRVRVYLDFGPGTVVERPRNGHPRMRAWLESPVREAAQVVVNGQPAGSLWKPPYELEISGALRPGDNHLKITVENLAINWLAGRSLRNYRLLNNRYGERFAPQDMENLQPLPSGLLGPVRLLIQEVP